MYLAESPMHLSTECLGQNVTRGPTAVKGVALVMTLPHPLCLQHSCYTLAYGVIAKSENSPTAMFAGEVLGVSAPFKS